MRLTAPTLPVASMDSPGTCGKDNVWEMPVNESPIDTPDLGLDNGSGNDSDNDFSSTSNNGSDRNQDGATEGNAQHELLVSGLHYSVEGGKVAVEIRRGMTILTTEGEVAGIVAGVINNREPQQVQYILLSRPSQQLEYRLIPIELVQQVSEETVSLHLLAALVGTLPPWHR